MRQRISSFGQVLFLDLANFYFRIRLVYISGFGERFLSLHNDSAALLEPLQVTTPRPIPGLGEASRFYGHNTDVSGIYTTSASIRRGHFSPQDGQPLHPQLFNAFGPDVGSGIAVAVMVSAAVRASPFTRSKIKLLKLEAAAGARL